jgi:enoyl-CoA hydratase/carnithine racemase
MNIRELHDQLGGYVDYEHFDSYSERFKEFFDIKRTDNGIITVRMHYKGGEAGWCYGLHNGWSRLIKAIAQDPENEVLIITGTGDHWIGPIQQSNGKAAFSMMAQDPIGYARTIYDDWYVDGQSLLTSMINDIDIPTISCVNGPSPGHTEFALACDICLCTPDANFVEPHFSAGPGFVPGDGQMLAFQVLLGPRRANYMAYTGRDVVGEKALEWGLVDEVVERNKLMDRAMEIAQNMMKRDRMVRRLTHDVMRQPWKAALEQLKFSQQFALECWTAGLSSADNIVKATKTLMDEGMAEKEKNRGNTQIK